MLMKDPGRRWEPDPEPDPEPGSMRSYLLLLLGIAIAIALAAVLAPLSGPATRCVRPVGWHVTGRVSVPLCGTRGVYRLPTGH